MTGIRNVADSRHCAVTQMHRYATTVMISNSDYFKVSEPKDVWSVEGIHVGNLNRFSIFYTEVNDKSISSRTAESRM